MQALVRTLLLVGIAMLPGCRTAKEPAPATPAVAPAAASGWDRTVEEYTSGYFQHRPDLAVSAGRHEFDGLLPDWSPEGISRFVSFLKTWRIKAEGHPTANDREAFEKSYVLAQIDGDLFWIEIAEAPFTNPYYYSSFNGVDPNVYLTREYAPLEVRLRAFNKYLANLPAALKQIRANLRTPMPRTFAAMGRTTFGGLASFFETDVPKIFAEVSQPALQAELKTATAAAIRELKALDAWFESEARRATDKFPLGAMRFERMLRDTERVDIPLDELERIGRADLARNVAALKKACAQLAPDKSIAECLNRVRGRKPPAGPVLGARQQLGELRQFLMEKDLVTIPGTEEAQVQESPPYMRWNFAYINIPGPYDKGLPSIYYIAPPEPNWSPKEQFEYIPGEPDLLFTSVHEVWPGHFLQFLHANRSPSKFGQIFVGYAFAEGWAHYTEEMMWEAGLRAGDPAAHIGQLINAMLRNARYISAIGLHTGKMSLAESEQFFREEAFQDTATARQQAARGTFDPAYLNYTMGKLMIRKLRDDWCATRGGRAAWKEFHDRFLGFGGPPVPLVRQAMLGTRQGLF